MGKPLLWRLTIEPLKPKEKTVGGIVLAPESIDATEVQTCVGKVLAMGALCYKSKPRPGLDFEQEMNRARVGDYILYGAHSGQKVKLRDGSRRVVLNDSDVLENLGPDENAAREVVSYV